MDSSRITHIIESNKAKLKELKDNQDNLSVWGFRDVGYYEGRISGLEDLLDEIKSKDAEIEKLQNALVISQKETRRYAQRWPEAIKEFAKRLKEKERTHTGSYKEIKYILRFVETEEIDKLVNKMAGEING